MKIIEQMIIKRLSEMTSKEMENILFAVILMDFKLKNTSQFKKYLLFDEDRVYQGEKIKGFRFVIEDELPEHNTNKIKFKWSYNEASTHLSIINATLIETMVKADMENLGGRYMAALEMSEKER